MNIDQENFAKNLAAKTKTHDEWLAVVRYGLGTLMDAPHGLLAEIIGAEAKREAEKNNDEPHWELGRMMRELGLKFSR